jgi:hypothetical protein
VSWTGEPEVEGCADAEDDVVADMVEDAFPGVIDMTPQRQMSPPVA